MEETLYSLKFFSFNFLNLYNLHIFIQFLFNKIRKAKREKIMKVLDDGCIIEKEIGIITIYTFCILYTNAASQVENVFCDYLGRFALDGESWQLSQDLNFPQDELHLWS